MACQHPRPRSGKTNLFRSRWPVPLMAGKSPFTLRGELPGSRDNDVHFVQDPFDILRTGAGARPAGRRGARGGAGAAGGAQAVVITSYLGRKPQAAEALEAPATERGARVYEFMPTAMNVSRSVPCFGGRVIAAEIPLWSGVAKANNIRAD